MTTAIRQFEIIRKDAEKIANNETQRFPEAASDGDTFRQGDIYVIHRDELPNGCKECKCELQLAPGSTQGSRHCLDSSDGVTMYRVENGDALQGPVFETAKERTITHPEHGHVVLPPGCYEITYQRAYADELRRVMD